MITAWFLTVCTAIGLGNITGTVLDPESKPVEGAVVTVLDAKTGVPVRRETWKPFTDGTTDTEAAMDDIVFAPTDESGEFDFTDVPSGNYRLVAQSWVDQPTPDSVVDVIGPTIHLRGIASVSVDAKQTSTVQIRPLGSTILVLGDHAPNDQTLLLLSTSEPTGDPALGFFAWPGPFLQSMIGFNRMPDGATVVRGLPETLIHVAIFSADNNPGFASASLELSEDTPMYLKIPFIASWSDAVHQPPVALRDLTDRVADLSEDERTALVREVRELLTPNGQERGSMTSRSIATGMDRAAERTIELPDAGQIPMLDFMAALHYVTLMEKVESRGRQPNPWRAPEIRPATPSELIGPQQD